MRTDNAHNMTQWEDQISEKIAKIFLALNMGISVAELERRLKEVA